MASMHVRPPRLVGFGGRPYNFFERDAVADNLANVLGGRFRCVVLAEGVLVFGDDQGNVTFTDGDLHVSIQHKLFMGPVLLLARSRENPPTFVAAGMDGPGGDVATVKTWVGSKVMTPAHSIDIAQQLKGTYKLEPTALACNFDGTRIAVGFASGLVVLLEGEFSPEKAKLKPATSLHVPARGADFPVTGLHFLQPPDPPRHEDLGGGPEIPVLATAGSSASSSSTAAGGRAQPSVDYNRLYVVFDNQESVLPATVPTSVDAAGQQQNTGGVLVYDTVSKGRPVTLDEVGASAGCSAVDPTTQDLAVGRSDAMYFYSEEEGRKGALGFEVRQGLCLLGMGSVLVATVDEQSGRSIINVYDLRNKFVAFQATLAPDQKVAGLVAEGPLAYVMTTQGNVIRLREKDIAAKLKLLVEDMKLYGVAIKLAYSSNYDVHKIMEIYKLYGNYLYEKKRDYDGAIRQYINTIGYLDPSYVITRFLDAQRIKNLTQYLEALHRRGQATADLTTFLLNCYTKLKDVEKLDQFINPERYVNADGGDGPAGGAAEQRNDGATRQAGGGGAADGGSSAAQATAQPHSSEHSVIRGPSASEALDGHNFDVQTAIQVLKGAGYIEHALELARKIKAHDWYLRVQLERPTPSYRDALVYISGLPFEAAERHMRTYGKRFMGHLPEETTAIIMALCTGRFQPRRPRSTSAATSTTDGAALSASGTGAVQRAKAENFVHLFVDHPQWLRTFLECVMKEPGLTVSPSVANTLLELLIQEWEATLAVPRSEEVDRIRRRKEADVMACLEQHHGRYDEDHALVLVQMHRFKPGQLFMYDKTRNADLALDYFISEGDTAAVLSRIARKENKKNPDLWVKVLTYIVEAAKPRERATEGGAGVDADDDDDEDDDSDDEEAAWDDMVKVLQMIEREQVLPPLQVLDILSRNDAIPMFVVRDYVSRLLREAYADVNGSQAKIDGLKRSTTEMRAEVNDLRSTARVFQATKCHRCGRALDLPAVHFLCMHPYHVDCLFSENECNECAPEHHKYEGIKKGQSGKAMDHEHFFSELEEQGFAAVASYFGKGVLNAQIRRESRDRREGAARGLGFDAYGGAVSQRY